MKSKTVTPVTGNKKKPAVKSRTTKVEKSQASKTTVSSSKISKAATPKTKASSRVQGSPLPKAATPKTQTVTVSVPVKPGQRVVIFPAKKRSQGGKS